MRSAFLIFVLLAISCAVAHAQYDDGEYEVMAIVDDLDDDYEFEVYGGEQVQLQQPLAKQMYTAPARMEELTPIQNKAIYLPAQTHKEYSSKKQMRTKEIPVRKTQTVLIRQPIIRTQRYKQPVIQPVITQPVVTTRIVTQPVKQPVLTTKTVTQPKIYKQPIIVRQLSNQYQTKKAQQRKEYATNPTITQQTQMLQANPIENPPQYFNLPAQVQEESGKMHTSDPQPQIQLQQQQQSEGEEQQQQQQETESDPLAELGEQQEEGQQLQQEQEEVEEPLQQEIEEEQEEAMPQQQQLGAQALAQAGRTTTAAPLTTFLARSRGRL